MEINDEHRVMLPLRVRTMLHGEPAQRHMSNDTDPAFESSPYHKWNTSSLLLLNTTDASAINLWNLTNSTFKDLEWSNETLREVTNSSGISNASTPARDALSWWDVWTGTPFPSGYTQLAIVILAFFLTCIMILVVVGNMLVCIAIATEKSLKPVQNWFIASLAVSDFLIGLVIMPFSLARELMGYWMFGQVWCDVHAALDVLLCTASINSLFLISLDRYWSITQAVKYLKKRTPSRAAFMIASVWILSALVSLPPLVGWKKAEQSSEYPQCNLSEDIGYVLYSSIGSFYFPALMMVFVYARIFIAARSRARRHIEKKRLRIPIEPHADALKEKSTTTTICTSFSNPSPPDLTKAEQVLGNTLPKLANIQVNVCSSEENNASGLEASSTLPLTKSPPPQIVIEASPDSRRQSWNIISTSELISSININNGDQLCATESTAKEDAANSLSSTAENSESEQPTQSAIEGCEPPAKPTKVYFPRLKSVSSKAFRFRKPRMNGLTKNNSLSKSVVTVDEDSDTADSPTSKEHPNYESKAFLSAPKLLRSKFGSSLSIVDYEDSDLMEDDKKRTKSRVQYHDPPVVGIHIPTDAERHKRKIAKARERRATLIVGLIMAAFITAWLPFFVLYVLAALCGVCKATIPEGVFAVAFWLGYCNSAANPIIYTIFNRDYRKAFRKILFK